MKPTNPRILAINDGLRYSARSLRLKKSQSAEERYQEVLMNQKPHENLNQKIMTTTTKET